MKPIKKIEAEIIAQLEEEWNTEIKTGSGLTGYSYAIGLAISKTKEEVLNLINEMWSIEQPEKVTELKALIKGEKKKEMEVKLATIKCEKCDRKGYIGSWRVGTDDLGNLVRVCPKCNHEQKI